MRRKQLLYLVLSCLAAIALLLPLGRFLRAGSRSRSAVPEAQKKETSQASVLSDYGKLPLTFEENQGQTDARVKFMARGSGYTVFLSDDETTTLRLIAPSNDPASLLHPATRSSTSAAPTNNPDALVQLSLVGANPHAPVEGNDLQPGRSNYFIGNDPARWQRNVPHFARVKFRGVYPGVDLVYYGNQGRLESDYVLAPGVNPGQIGLHINGARTVKLDSEGALVLATHAGDIVLHKPRAYQDTAGGRQEIAANFVQEGPQLVSFRVAPYDTRLPLIIDPVMVYSTYLGGALKDFANAIAVDATGNAYVTGFTSSKIPGPFPTQNPLANQGNLLATGVNAQEAFVTKLNPAGSALIYSTYLGGTTSGTIDQGFGIAVNANGEAFVVGTTGATDFPTMNPILTNNPNTAAAVFLTQLNATGSALLYSTYLGGSGRDEGLGIALDPAGIAYITGVTTSGNFPLTFGTAFQTSIKGSNTGFISKIDTTKVGLPSLLYSTYLGGSGGDTPQAIAVDSTGNAYITGQTGSTDFPRPLPSPPGLVPFQPAIAGRINAFIAKVDTSGTNGLVYSTYLGGTGTTKGGGDQGNGIALDGSNNGHVYIVGTTGSNDFPVSTNAFQTTNPNIIKNNNGLLNRAAFVARLDTTKSGAPSLIYSTYLGGTGSLGDSGAAIAVDSLKNAYVTGHETSNDFPVTLGAPQPSPLGQNAFVTVINPTGTSPLVLSTFWGGTQRDDGTGIALDTSSPPNVYLTGGTNSSDFPTSSTPFQMTIGGGSGLDDAFVTKFSAASVAGTVSVAPASLPFGSQAVNTISAPKTVTLTNGANVALTINKISFAGANASDFTETSTGATACPISPATLAAGANCTLSVTFTPTTTAAESATLTIDDTSAGAPLQQHVTLTGTGTASGTADFTVSVTPASATATAGASANFTVTVTSITGFNAAVAAACTGAPPAGTCTLVPTSVTPAANGTATINGTITTSKRTLAPPLLFRVSPRFPSWLWGFMSLAMAILAAWAATRRATRKLAFGFGVLSLLALTGCSGPIHGGTPAGPYTVTITATSGALNHSTNFALTVN